MKEEIKKAVASAEAELEKEFRAAGTNYLDQFKGMLVGTSGVVRQEVQKHLDTAADYHFRAIKESTVEGRRPWVEGAADELASARLILTSHGVATSEEQAMAFQNGFLAVLSALGRAGQAILTTVVAAFAKGLADGIAGELGGSDATGPFPGAK